MDDLESHGTRGDMDEPTVCSLGMLEPKRTIGV